MDRSKALAKYAAAGSALDKRAFMVVLHQLAAVFGRDVSAPGYVDAYWDVLRGFTAEALERGRLQVLKTSRFMPTPSELRAAMVDCAPRRRAL